MEDNNGQGTMMLESSQNESESTQIMNFALGAAAPNQGKGMGGPSTNPLTAESSASKNGSGGESLLSDTSNGSALARFHFHGLANTQTQTQLVEVEFDGEDQPNTESQKENSPSRTAPSGPQSQIQAQLATRAVSATNKQTFCEANEQQQDAPSVTPGADDNDTPSGVAPSMNTAQVVLVPDTPSLSTLPLPTAPQNKVQTKVVSLRRTSRPTVAASTSYKAQPKMRLRRRRSLSPSSQDSFAGPTASEDPDIFLATSKQFVKPLSELGSPEPVETQTQDNQSSEVESSVDRRTGKAAATAVVTQMTPYSLSSTSSHPLPVGRVLVVNSDDSNGPSQGSADSSNSANGFAYFGENHFSQQATQLNTSLNVEADTSADSTGNDVATQIVGDSSQLVAETTNTTNMLPPSFTRLQKPLAASLREHTTAEIPATNESAASATSSISLPPRSILGLASASKLQRYMMNPGVLPSTRVTQPQHAPVNLPGPGPSRAAVTRQPIPLQPAASTSTASMPLTNTGASVRVVVGTPTIERDARMLRAFSKDTSSGVQESEQQVEDALRKSPSKSPTKSPSFGNVATSTQKGARSANRAAPMVPAAISEANEDVITESVTEPTSSAPLATYAPALRDSRATPSALTSPGPETEAISDETEEEESKTEDQLVRKGQKGKSVAKPAQVAKEKADTRKTTRVAQSKLKPKADLDYSDEEAHVNEIENPPATRGSSRPRRGAASKRAQRVNTPAVGKGKGKVKQEPALDSPRNLPRAIRGGRTARGVRASPAVVRSTPRMKPAIVPHTPIDQTGMQVDDDEDDEEEVNDLSPDVPLAGGRDVEVATVIDEEEEDAGESNQGVSLSRKRKREPSGRSVQASRSGRSSVLSLSGPPQKRVKNYSFSKELPPTRVFALWKTDNLYYTGTVHSVDRDCSTKFLIHFDDGTEDTVDIKKMRQCSLRIGDDIIANGKKMMCRVTDVSEWSTRNICNVLPMDEEDEEELEARDVTIASRTLLAKWNDRVLQVNDIVPRVGRKPLRNTPSPSKLSFVGGACGRASKNKSLARIGFVITLAPGNVGWESAKDRVVKIIKENGGTVLGDWSDILNLQGRHESGNKRWVIEQCDLEFLQFGDVQSVYLLADVPNQKPKYLVALGLGVPCLSIDWLEARTRQPELDWHNYLLPAGFSEQLDARVSQVVDLDWGNSSAFLTDIARNPVPHKVLKGCSVLCLGTEFVPIPRRKNGADVDKAAEASRTVPRIVLAMGADRVEAVADTRHASQKDLTKYDYVVVKDAPPKLPTPDVVYVNVAWIKECLIASRLLPLDSSGVAS